VVHAPPANERLKIWSAPVVFWRKIDHGTSTPPASEPPTTSEFAGSSAMSTGFAGSIPAAGSLFTCAPGGSA